MHSRVVLSAIFLLAAATFPVWAEDSAASTESVDPNLIDGIAAEVNGEAITLQEVLDLVRGSVQMRRADSLSPAEIQKIYAASLENAIRSKLVLQEYERGDMRLPDWIVDKRVSETIDSLYGGDRTKLLEELSRQRTTFEEWREELTRATVLMAMRQANIDKNVHVGPAAVRDYYLAHPETYTRSAGTHMLLLQLKRKDGEPDESFQKRVDTVRARLAKEPFQEIARFFSADASAPRGGDWGWIQPDMLRRELAEALPALAVGETSAPIETSSGVYFLRKEGERADGLQPLESVRDEIVSLLRKQESERLFQEWTERLREKAQVRVLRPQM